MGIDGFLVITKGGKTFYSKIYDIDVKIDNVIFGNFISLIQT
jgi:hypothetical protein